MEVCARRFLNLEQISVSSVMGCELKQAVAYQPAPSPRQVICPEPRRMTCAPPIVDNFDRICYKQSNLPSNRGDCKSEILNLILAKDDLEDHLDANSNQMGFFFGSPPVRTGNPLIHDVQFVQQTSTWASPVANFEGGKTTSARVDRVPSCGASLFGGKPMVRIEGFACRSSNSHCIAPALA